VQSAGSDPIEGDEALALLEGAERLIVARGSTTLEFDLTSNRPDDDRLLTLMLGRTGKLRAPTMKVGERVIVGYNSDLLEDELG